MSQLQLSVAGIISDLVSSLIANAISALVVRCARRGVPLPLLIHKRELLENLRHMPFIYKDLDTDVVCDFVDVDIQSLDLRTFRGQGVSPPALLKQRLQTRRKVVLLGNAGIGKTTYFRHTILSLLSGEKKQFLYEKENIVPFFIPLKAVQNARPYPIANYVLGNNIY